MNQPWRIEMFGGLRALQDDQVTTRFATRKNAVLLAFLAFYIRHAHSRETLIEMLWPGVEPETGRNRLRQALASLRRQLEPPGFETGSVLIADRNSVALNPLSARTDVAEFDELASTQQNGVEQAALVARLTRAAALAQDELLSGYYDDWIVTERERLAGRRLDVLRQLTAAHEAAGDLMLALQWAREAVCRDPLDEAAQATLIRLQLVGSQPAQAVRQYHEFARALRDTLGQAPLPATRQLIESALGPGRTHGTQDSADRPQAPAVPQAPPPLSGIAARIETPCVAPQAEDEPSAVVRLPIRFTRFFGRSEQIEALLQLLSAQPTEDRLITLVGPGGCGKTRLAIEVARKAADRTGCDVWFAPLDDVADPRLLPGALAAALKLPSRTDIDPLEQVARTLERRPTLLLLDNFEQLLAAAGTPEFDSEASRIVVRTLLQRVPTLTCIATSRQALEIEGEREFPVPPLPIPTKDEGGRMKDEAIPAPSSLLSFPSVQLFVDRAKAVRPDFQVTPRTAGAVAAIIERLEGIPLAIELAAAWARTLSTSQIVERFSQGFELLATRRQDLPLRHRTLRATVEWSYRLLPEHLQQLFTRLSIFRGGWTGATAAAICMDPDGADPAEEFQSQVWELQARSLVFMPNADEERRMRMLDTLREYAAERLPEAERDRLARRHARVFTEIAESQALRLLGTQQDAACQTLNAERHNLRAALHWALHADPEMALRLVGALWRYWALRSEFAEGRDMLSRALQHESSPGVRAQAVMGAGILAQFQGDFTAARTYHEELLRLSIDLGAQSAIANAHNNLGRLDYEMGNLDGARAHYEAGLTRWRDLGDRQHVAIAYNNLGLVAREQGDFSVAASLFEQSLTYKRELGDRPGIATALNNLGLVAGDREHYQTARALFEEAVTLYRELGNRANEAVTLSNLARTLTAQRDHAAALRFHSESLLLRRDLGDRQGVTFSLEGFAMLATDAGQAERAARLLGASEALRETLGAPVPRTDRPMLADTQSQIRAALGDEVYAASHTLGRALTLDQAISYALETALPH